MQTVFERFFFLVWLFVAKYAPGIRQSQVLLPQGCAAFELYFLPGLSSTHGFRCVIPVDHYFLYPI